MLPGITEAATTEDLDGAFSAGSVAALGEVGLLRVPLRQALDGQGWGIELARAVPLARALDKPTDGYIATTIRTAR